MKNFIRTKLQSFLGVFPEDREEIDTLINDLESKIEELEGEISDLESSVGDNADEIEDIQRDFRQYPDAEDIPDETEMERNTESLISEAIEDAFESFHDDNVGRISKFCESLDYSETAKILELSYFIGSICEEQYSQLVERFFEKN